MSTAQTLTAEELENLAIAEAFFARYWAEHRAMLARVAKKTALYPR